MCRHLKYVVWLWLLCWASPLRAGNDIDVAKIVLEHVSDAYEWHVTTWGETEWRIPLPVIVYSRQTGWHCFMSDKIYPVGTTYEGLHIAAAGKYEGKIVEGDVRPFDISITKTVAGLLINCVLLLTLVLLTARWYRRHATDDAAPHGFVGLMEMLIMMIDEDVIHSCIGKDYKRYSPYLLTAFFFIFVNNLMGLLPIFPGGANVTGNIAVTMVLALCTFVAVNVFGSRTYWKDILWPEVPLMLKCPIPLMPVIELFGIFTKPFALMIRLFANILAGHFIILALTCIIFVTAAMGPVFNGPMTVLSVAFSIFMNCLELLVAFIQAYVFTMLSAVFIGMSRTGSE